ncbi:MAG TPA: hypothetical protein VF937_09840 [Chloroflexota bacterium]
MLRQIERLTRKVGRAGSDARAIAVYAEPSAVEPGDGLTTRGARESGAEGVACVDDAARAVVLYCRLWRQSRLEQARAAAYGLLRFLAYMQEPDGRFSNFIFDWAGRRNRTGATSYPGGGPWQARATHALACAVGTFGETEWGQRFQLAAGWLDAPTPYLDVRAVGVLSQLEYWQATGSSASAARAISWSAEIAAHSSGGRLLNATGVLPIHLWGHLQERALANTGAALRRAELVDIARTSAESVLMPAVEGGFAFTRVLPFDVSCTTLGLAAVADATGEERYTAAAIRAREWFGGRNTAAQAVYDDERGLVFDGIDNGQVSRNSGAESNIEGALALLC